MATYDDVMARLNAVFCEVFDDDSIKIFDAMTAEDLDEWDSLSHITLVLAVEREFHIKLKAAEVGRLADVGEMAKLLIERSGDRARPDR
jgi:acyl carrier protein